MGGSREKRKGERFGADIIQSRRFEGRKWGKDYIIPGPGTRHSSRAVGMWWQ